MVRGGRTTRWDVSHDMVCVCVFDDISKWDVSGVTYMTTWFDDISKWNVSGVTYMTTWCVCVWPHIKVRRVRSDIHDMVCVCVWRHIKVGRDRSDIIHDMVCVFGDISKWDVSGVTYMT